MHPKYYYLARKLIPDERPTQFDTENLTQRSNLLPDNKRATTLPSHTETPSSANEPKHRLVYIEKEQPRRARNGGKETLETESKMAPLPANHVALNPSQDGVASGQRARQNP